MILTNAHPTPTAPLVQKVMQAIMDGHKSVEDIAKATKMGEILTLIAVDFLIRNGHLKRAPEGTTSKPAPAERPSLKLV